MPPTLRGLLAAALLAQLPAAAQDRAPASPPAPLTVAIRDPQAGVVDADLVTTFEATVSDPRVRTALLTVNGLSYEVPVRDGHVTQNLVVAPGNNRVALTATRNGVTASDSTTFFLRGPRVDLVVLLGWASRGEIIDLWTREPSGETCKWDHRETASGGRLLDFSTDAIGFGSQAYVLPTVAPGRYRVKIHYWSARAWDDDRSGVDLDSSLSRLDTLAEEIERATGADRLRLVDERGEVERRLDRWSEPAAPQTPVHGEIVLFPNSRHERRWRFDRTTPRTGSLDTLGEVEVSAEMIRAAREAVAP
ncbi:MAG: hypothetical protein U0324_40640 [Polyangiales bacterium]